MATTVDMSTMKRERITGRAIVALPATAPDLYYALAQSAGVGVPIVPSSATERTFMVEGDGYLGWSAAAGPVEVKHVGPAETGFDVRQLR